MEQKETVKIVIENSLSTKSFEEGFRIHRREYEKVSSMIDKQLNIARGYKEELAKMKKDDELHRSHSTISVFGERGVGKTSFLLSLREKYNKNQDVKVLPIVDPTLIEEKGHVFLLLISIIDDVVCRKIREQHYSDDEDKEKRAAEEHDWDIIKDKIAKGLPSLDRVGLTYEEPQWQQDEYVMTKGMQSVSAAFNLERNFHVLIGKALEILGASAFLLMFDDIDVDFKKGWKVLETIRKYLTTPQIVIILSGNMKLYSKNVRKQQWLNLGKALLKNEADRNESAALEYNRLVNELEGQYLLKVLKSENRVYLHSIYENISTYGVDYQIEKSNRELVKITDYYRTVFESYGIYGKAAVDLYTNFLLNTSVRTQMHFLVNAFEAQNDSLLSTINAFISRIYAQGVDIDLATNERNFNIVLLHYLVDKELVEEAYQLLPNFDSTDINSTVAGFNFLFAQLMNRNPSLIFDYWTRISYTRDAMPLLKYDISQQNSVKRYCTNSGSYRARGLRSIIGNGLAFLRFVQRDFTGVGNIDLMGFARTEKKGSKSRIDVILENKGVCQVLGYLPLLSLASANQNSHQLVFSLYGLLSNIGDLLNADAGIMCEVLAEAAQPRSYQLQTFGADEDDSTNEDMGIGIDVSFDDKAIRILANSVISWRNKYKNLDISYGAHLFGRISTRLYFALRNIESSSTNRGKRLGDMMSLMVMALYNASLIEEAKERYSSGLGKLNINNVASSSKILMENASIVANSEQINGELPFTKWLISCPLLYPFVPEIATGKISQFIDKDTLVGYDNIMKEGRNLLYVLNSISIKSIARFRFTFSKGNKEKTLKYINDYLNAEVILNSPSLQDAADELGTIFVNASISNVKTIRKECEMDGGLLVLRQQNNEVL